MADTSQFVYRASFGCSVTELYQWHARDGALERLIPPWERTSVVMKEGGIEPGGKVVMLMHAGLVPFHWVAHHIENQPNQYFRDIQVKGPFSSWSHWHIFSAKNDAALLEDRIEYALPFHAMMPCFLKKHVENTLQRTFIHRQRVLSADLDLHRKVRPGHLHILISGAGGVLGKSLQPLLTTAGHTVWKLVRRVPERTKNELFWDPMTGEIDDLPQIDAVIHLAGEYIGLGRWTDSKKRLVIESRNKGTALLAQKIAAAKVPPKVFLSASAVGYYGDRQDQAIDETCNAGSDFISEVCRVWEEAAEPARKAGIRTILMRIGVTLTPRGGALQRMLSGSQIGLFRRFGSGNQYVSWISVDDTISAIYYAMCCESLTGALNITAPHPVTNKKFMETLSQVTGRPLIMPVPAGLLKIVYGQMASEILLSGCRADCRKLIEAGYRFRHETLEEALTALLGKSEMQQNSEDKSR